MTEREYVLLSSVRDGSIQDYKSLDQESAGLLMAMGNRGFVTLFLSGSLHITPEGVAALAAHKEQSEKTAAKDAEQKKDKAFNHKIQILQLVIPTLTFFLGLFLEHYAHVVSLILSMFH